MSTAPLTSMPSPPDMLRPATEAAAIDHATRSRLLGRIILALHGESLDYLAALARYLEEPLPEDDQVG